jgi:YegS C-terminal NAD kinase beta sandwich-like domain
VDVGDRAWGSMSLIFCAPPYCEGLQSFASKKSIVVSSTSPSTNRGLPHNPCRERSTDGRGLRERKTIFRVPRLRLGRSPVSAWGGDKVGSAPQVVRVHAPRLPLSVPKIRAHARPTSVRCPRARITNENHRLIDFLTQNRRSNLTLSALMLTVSNGPYFGMNYAVAPEQRVDDGLLTVSVFSRYSKLQLWWHFASIAFGRREYSPKSIAFRVAKLRVDGPRKLPVRLDGSPQKDLWPLDVECNECALRVFRKTLQ